MSIQLPWFPPPPRQATDRSPWRFRIWQLDQRWFKWDQLPSLAKLPFIRSSYIVLILFPVIHGMLAPVFRAKTVIVDVPYVCLFVDHLVSRPGLCKEGSGQIAIQLSTSIGYNWYLIYLLTLSLTIGSIIYEVFRPKIVGDDVTDAKYLKVIYNFRDVAVHLAEAQRQSHFIHNFLGTFGTNYQELMEQTEQATSQGIKAIPSYGSAQRVDRRSVYYCAHHMKLREHYLDDALSMTLWYSNELRMPWRWACGICFLISVTITMFLFLQGLRTVVFV